jgi:D-glucosaminate-6-phosphate ammonia-lyase
VVADRICAVLSQKRSPKPPLKPPVANLNGRWDATIEFFSSKSEPALFIVRIPGNNITFIFSGTVSGDTISGPIRMGGYLTARFTGRRHSYPEASSIVVPQGPPLAN